MGPTGNLQGSVKFYCINTGRVLKRRSFTPMPMPDRVIKQVNKIGEREGQGQTFCFLNQKKQAYEWTDEVPKDNNDFQGLLEDEVEAAPYPDISAELQGVELDEEEREFQTILDETELDFRDMAAAALLNAGIDGDETARHPGNMEFPRRDITSHYVVPFWHTFHMWQNMPPLVTPRVSHAHRNAKL